MTRIIAGLCSGLIGMVVGFYVVRAQRRNKPAYVVLERQTLSPSEVPGSLFIRADLEAVAR